MPVLGAVAAALALFATAGDHAEPGREQAQLIAARLAARPIPGASYVADLVDAMIPPVRSAANGPCHDGMSLRELRSADLSGQITLPLFAGRF